LNALLLSSRERIRFLRFCVVGVIGAVVDFGVSNLLIQLAGFSLVTAGTISFIAAILSNFFWNRIWTYPDSRSKNMYAQLLQFGLVSMIGLAIRVPILNFLGPALDSLFTQMNLSLGSSLSATVLANNLTLAVAVFIVMFWNFFANRFWTYGDVE
jgi:putative flippase GtrA